MLRLLFSCFLIFACLTASVWGSLAQQQPQELEKRKKSSREEVKKMQRMLQKVTQKKKLSLHELTLVRKQVALQKEMIAGMEQEVEQLNQEVQEMRWIVEAMRADLQSLKSEYALMIYAAAKTTTSLNRLSFLFASTNVNQLYHRVKYLQQYGKARRKQVLHIKEVQATLEVQQKKTQEKIQEKKALLAEKKMESDNLSQLLLKKNQLYAHLGSQEKQLRAELKETQEKLARLEKAIVAQTKSNSPGKANKPSASKPAPISKKELTLQFKAKKGKLNWPVAQGFIASRFGKHEHPVLKGVTIDNSGIDIQTPKNEGLRPIHLGQVISIAKIPGMGGKVIMMQHGDYFSVYAQVKDIKVAVGDWVNEKNLLATVFHDVRGHSRLQFQIWKGSSKLDPSAWLNSR